MTSNEASKKKHRDRGGVDESIEKLNVVSRKKVGSGDEMPTMPTMSMRAAQHDLSLEREKFNNQNAPIANNTF